MAIYGDRWLSRSIAVLSIEGPGQYESAVLGIPVSMDNWIAAGRAMMEWISVGNVPSTNLGPTPPVLVADWMNARLAGKPFPSERWLVESNGRVVKTPL